MAATESGPAAVGGVSATSAPLIVWDFDWSLVNENSDTFVIRELEGRDGPVWRSNVGQWDRTGGWTALMDRCVKDLWAAGSHKTQFTECLGKIPILSGADKAARLVRARGVEQRILSDANEFYIDAILEAKGLADGVFSTVVTNIGRFDGPDGRLEIRPHHPPGTPPHNCPHCPTNLCKGSVLKEWMAELQPSKVLYVGDGSGDFCPSLLLQPGSVILARGAPHNRLLQLCVQARDAGTLRAEVVEWPGDDDGAVLLQTITKFLDSSSM